MSIRLFPHLTLIMTMLSNSIHYLKRKHYPIFCSKKSVIAT